jgi:DNA modification methylase
VVKIKIKKSKSTLDNVKSGRWVIEQKDIRDLVVGDGATADLSPNSVHLVITSPPYWNLKDYGFEGQIGYGQQYWEYLVDILKVFEKVYNAMVEGGILCINAGSVFKKSERGEGFARQPIPGDIESKLWDRGAGPGWSPLPKILWKKITSSRNAPFLGSGLFPVNAYVTNDVEDILVFRKGGLRKFGEEENLRRKRSSFTVEERNKWFTQIWDDVPGIGKRGEQQAAWPREIPYRLIRMFSIEGDKVFDPFCGSGIGPKVAAELGRAGIGIDKCDLSKSRGIVGTPCRRIVLNLGNKKIVL